MSSAHESPRIMLDRTGRVMGNPGCWSESYSFTECCYDLNPRCFPNIDGDPFSFENCCGFKQRQMQSIFVALKSLRKDLERAGTIDRQKAWKVCQEVVSWPRSQSPGSKAIESALTDLSRLVFSYALASDRVVHTTLDKADTVAPTCSYQAIHSRFPTNDYVDVDFKANDIVNRIIKFHFSPNVVPKFLESMLAHHRHCREKGHRCPFYNPWSPSRCFEHHPVVWPWLASCLPRPVQQHAEHVGASSADRAEHMLIDWLGVRLPGGKCDEAGPQGQKELTRQLECLLPGQQHGVVIGEDYFESITLLKGVQSATKSFVMFDLGSSWGYWSVKAAVAWRRLHRSAGPCRLVLVETDREQLYQARQHAQRNGVTDYCNMTLLNEPATSPLVSRLLRTHRRVDLVHSDIQGAEMHVFGRLPLIHKIRHLHMTTHSRELHRFLREVMHLEGFRPSFDFVPRSFVETPFGPMAFDDGVLAGAFEAEGGDDSA
eukprot:TRINITY_DN27769_c0_g1_i2.p1 TRINITY_DN27769_c0_g1~~TRINITY_DN27769_c0_g1_i2.p1  ORF type:complete len:487 (+),score=25.26 TRINITY_DN27769_c0_g1_i2:89-1549(+)